MRAVRAMVIVAALGALAGCGQSTRDQVQAKVDQFVTAVAGKDYKTLCDQVLAPSLLTHLAAGGIQCEQAMQIALGKVNQPALSVGRITVSGAHATAITLTTAKNEVASLNAIELIETKNGWRVDSLGPVSR
jgi:hypothetical protein